MTDRPAVVEIHRCDTCGRISTAKRKPTKHQRDVAQYYEEGNEGPQFVECGPFHTYRAVPVHVDGQG